MNDLQIDALIRSKRRSVSLRVLADGSLEVRAPLRYPEALIHAFVKSKADWIARRRLEQQQRALRHPAHTYLPGDTFLWLGSPVTLTASSRSQPAFEFRDGQFLLSSTALPKAREYIQRWYRQQSRRYLEQRLADLAAQHGFTYQRLRLSSARTRWGSCSSKGSISLAWRLVMAPSAVIDYVILHELAHLRHANHSAKFWAVVAAMAPDYKRLRAWLKDNGYALTLD